jgi:hypothetical protein
MNNPFQSAADPVGTLAKARQARANPPVKGLVFDFDALKVEEGIPFVPRSTPEGRWEPLFRKLTKPGQSVQMPRHLKGALAAAALNRKKKGKPGEYRVASTGEACRIWRIA